MTRTAWLMAVVVLLAAGAGGLGMLRCESNAPELALEGPIWVGAEGREVAFTAVDEDSGLRELTVTLELGESTRTLMEMRGSGGLPFGAGEGGRGGEFEVDVPAEGLSDGEGLLRVTAVDWSWRNGFDGNRAEISVPLTLDTKAPRIQVHNGLTYVKRAGSGAVSYSLNETARMDGVMVGDAFFRGFRASAQEDRRIAVFAVPRDAEENPRIRVVATDLAGNVGSRSWGTRLQDRQFQDTPIRLPKRFFETKVIDLAEELGISADEPVKAFQTINSQVRGENEAKIHELAVGASEPRHWIGPFLQMRNSKVTSLFAEKRSYRVDGDEVSTAIHYGYDLASTARAPIRASNTGRVIHAGPLGIYGDCVIIDHGLGITSLYGHLSQVDVAVGDLVEKSQTLGLSGATGLAGGDHLHFAILVGGVYVDPLEWWDPRFVKERIEARILAAGP